MPINAMIDREEQQPVDEVHDLVDRRFLRLLELGVVLQLRRSGSRRVGVDRGLGPARRVTPAASLASTKKSSRCCGRKFVSNASSEMTKSPVMPISEPS